MDEGVGAGISGGHPGKARGPGAGPLRPSEVTGWERGVQAFPHGDGPGASLHGESGREACELCPLDARGDKRPDSGPTSPVSPAPVSRSAPLA